MANKTSNLSVAIVASFRAGWSQLSKTEARKATTKRSLLWIASACWLIWITSPFLLQGRLGYVRSFELGDAVYPQVAYIVQMLRAGHFSLWLPAQGAGTDLLGNFNSPYLNVFLYVLLPTWLAHSLIITIVIAVAAFSTGLLLRRNFDCSMPMACAGGFFYGSWFLVTFGGLVLGYAAGLAFALAPMILDRFLRVRTITLKDFAFGVLLALAFAAGGHYTWSVFILAVDFICALLLAPQRLLRWLPQLGAIALITAFCQLPSILANLQTASISARTFETYYHWNKLLSLIENYSDNPSFAPYEGLVFTGVLAVGLAVISSARSLNALKMAWPALAFSLLFFLLPVIDATILYILSILNVGGFALDSNGDFGGPFDSRLRMSRAFVASVAAALSADIFWRELILPHFGVLRGFASRGIVCLRGATHGGGTIRIVSTAFGNPRWLGDLWVKVRKMELVSLRYAAQAVLVVAVSCGVASAAVHMFDLTSTSLHSMRRMAVDGHNFSAYYHHPQLLELASQNPDFESYRVATVLLNGPDVTGAGPCCEPRETSLSPGFQTAYSFEIADAYMSNLTRRSVDFWDLAIVGRPGFPRADFDRAVRERFLLPQHAFTQKLYLFQPIGTGQVDADGCIRPATPIEFSTNYNLDMLSLDNVKFIISALPLSDRRLTLLDSELRSELAALQCASGLERLAAFRSRGLAGRPLFIYRNDEAIPRVFAPQALEVVEDDNSLYNALTSRSAFELKRAALVVRKDLPATLAHAIGESRVTVEKVSVVRGDHLQIDTSSDAGGVLIVSSSYSPFWRASVAQKPIPIFPAYHTFIGISVPPGRQVIDLRYRPPYAEFLGYGKGG